MKYSIVIFAVPLLLLFIGCKGNNVSNKTLSLETSGSTLEKDTIREVEIPYIDSLGVADLSRLMDLIASHRMNPPLVTQWQISGNRIEVSLILNTDENIARFKKEVIDHPAIRFSKFPSLKLALPNCKDCGMEASLVPRVFTDSIGKITMTLANRSTYQAISGFHYTIFRHTGGQWEHIPFCFSTEDLGVLIPPGDSYQFDINLFGYAYNYPPGRYLVTKNFVFREDGKTINRYVVGAEFTVKQSQ